MPDKALYGVRVVECAQFVAGPYCTKLLADLGAEVIKVEPPQGDESRRKGPFLDETPHPERSGLFLYLNTNKLGLTLNLKTTEGRVIFQRLVGEADILVEDTPPAKVRELGLDYQTLREVNSKLVLTSITPFGQTGPYRDYQAYHLNLYHGSGLGYFTPGDSPDLNREPLKAGGFFGEYASGLSSAVATLAALYSQQLTGVGQQIDVSKQEALMDLHRIWVAFHPVEGTNPNRLARRDGFGWQLPCQDGYIVITLNEEHQWTALVELMGQPEWAQDERYKDARFRASHPEEIEPHIEEWMMGHTKEEIYHWGQELGLPVTPVMSAEDVVYSPQVKAQGFLVGVNHPACGEIEQPSAPYRFSETPWLLERPAPLLGEHNLEIYGQRLGYSKQDLVKLREAGII